MDRIWLELVMILDERHPGRVESCSEERGEVDGDGERFGDGHLAGVDSG